MKTIPIAVDLRLLSPQLNAHLTMQAGSSVFTLPVFHWQNKESTRNGIVGMNYTWSGGLKINNSASDLLSSEDCLEKYSGAHHRLSLIDSTRHLQAHRVGLGPKTDKTFEKDKSNPVCHYTQYADAGFW